MIFEEYKQIWYSCTSLQVSSEYVKEVGVFNKSAKRFFRDL